MKEEDFAALILLITILGIMVYIWAHPENFNHVGM